MVSRTGLVDMAERIRTPDLVFSSTKAHGIFGPLGGSYQGSMPMAGSMERPSVDLGYRSEETLVTKLCEPMQRDCTVPCSIAFRRVEDKEPSGMVVSRDNSYTRLRTFHYC